MNSFFRAEDLDPVAQRQISIPAENGLDFTPSQRIQFTLPPSTKFFQPDKCFLQANVSLTLPGISSASATRLQLDSEMGATCLIRDIRIHTAGGVLLEELQNVNTLMSVKYDYSTNQSIRDKRALTEGSTTWTPYTRGTKGQEKSNLNNFNDNPYFLRQTEAAVGGANFGNVDMKEAKVLIPLPTGIFMGSRVFPNMLVNGLRIEVVLEEPRFCFRQMDGVSRHRFPTLNPMFHSLNGSSNANHTATALGGWQTSNASDSFYVTRDNNCTSAENFPFVVGEKFKFVSGDRTTEAWNADGTTYSAGGAAGTDDFLITSIEFKTTGGSDGTDTWAVDNGDGLLKIGVQQTALGGGAAADAAPSANMSANRDGSSFNASSAFMFSTVTSGSTYPATYTLKNVELVVGEVEMAPSYEQGLLQGLKEGGTLSYMYPSYTNYKHSQLASERNTNIRLPMNNAKARAMLHIPCDASTRTIGNITNASGCYVVEQDAYDKIVRQQGAGLRGIWDHLSNYQMNYDNRLQPSRRVDCQKTANKYSISQQPMIELEKALLMAGFDPHSFKAFQSNAVIGRALALNNGVYDTRGKDYSLQVEYNESTAPALPKLWNSWCAHLRTLQIRGDSIQVEI